MPTVLSPEKVTRLIASARNLMHRTLLMMLYATGLRRAELCHLKGFDIDSQRMVIHIRHGKGGRDRDVQLTPKLLETLREYWHWMKPQTFCFRHHQQLAGRCAHYREDRLDCRREAAK